MKVRFNVTGAQRKELVTALATQLGIKAKYLGMPSAAYQVGNFTIDKEGTLTFDEAIDAEKTRRLLASLNASGFECELPMEEATPADAEPKEQSGNEPGLTIILPLEMVAVDRLTQIIEAKGALIKKALGIDALPIEVEETRVLFPWFPTKPADEEIDAIGHFMMALCKMSVEQKRINAKAKEVENDKYAFRCFLLRLGFIGTQYKEERKILLKNLSGNSAHKGGGKIDVSE